jgi:hypothetical protein
MEPSHSQREGKQWQGNHVLAICAIVVMLFTLVIGMHLSGVMHGKKTNFWTRLRATSSWWVWAPQPSSGMSRLSAAAAAGCGGESELSG